MFYALPCAPLDHLCSSSALACTSPCALVPLASSTPHICQ